MRNKSKSISVTDSSLYKLSSHSNFAYIEAYNHLRTNVMFSLAALNSPKKSIVVSSANPSEGKSTLSSNLAISLAKLEKKVLLIDADMRKPKLHRIFAAKNACGLSDILLGSGAEKAIVGISGLNLDFLPAGTVPPNPSELLGSKAFAELISEFEKIYDYIIIDTPPILVVSDALTLSNVSAGILLSSMYKNTSYSDFNKMISMLELAKFNILGNVIVGAKGHRKEKRYSQYGYND